MRLLKITSKVGDITRVVELRGENWETLERLAAGELPAPKETARR